MFILVWCGLYELFVLPFGINSRTQQINTIINALKQKYEDKKAVKIQQKNIIKDLTETLNKKTNKKDIQETVQLELQQNSEYTKLSPTNANWHRTD